jgi:uncharacterized protein (DUF302 family)
VDIYKGSGAKSRTPGVYWAEEKKVAYYQAKKVKLGFEQAIARVTEGLKAEGFGVLTDIDMSATLKKKLDADVRPYRILGACNPPFAYQALQAEDRIGLMLPCNVVVQQYPDGEVEVAAIDPTVAMKATGNERLAPIAEQVRQKLARVIAAL